MSMIIAHNIASINANKNLYNSNKSLNSSLSKLSSGFRINTGSDGPADLVISEQLRAQVYGLERAVRNTTEANNVLGIAEGALNEMNSILKKMKALAVHAANNGITSPDQVSSDQAEMDSGIQTLERIANTTKFSDQFLLNGAKDIQYSVTTEVKGTQNNKLINASLSTFKQIFTRDGYQVSVSFNGAVGANAVTGIGDSAAMSKQASKAYLEVDAYDGTISQVNEQGYLTKGQSFILTGSLGSRQFTFSEGAHLSEVVTAIHNVSGSTGVDAALTFNREQTINVANGTTQNAMTAVSMKGQDTGNDVITMYDNYRVNDQGDYELVLREVSAISGNVVYGKNTDGNGNVYVKVIANGDNRSYEVYKDASLSKESLIATGADDEAGSDRNYSDLSFTIDIAGTAKHGDVVKLSLGNIALTTTNANMSGAGRDRFEACHSTASGVQLGVNTDASGKIYLKTVFDNSGESAMVYAYNNELMREQDLVAKTVEAVDFDTADRAIILDSIWNDEKTANTGLGLTLVIAEVGVDGEDNNQTELSTIQFTNIGARIFANEYGSDHSVGVQVFEGGLFVDYEDQANYDSARLISAGENYRKSGQDATVLVNGQQAKTSGLKLNLATNDVMADLTFNSGKTGSTTIAQVGYGESTIFSKNTSLTFDYGLTANGNANTDDGSNSANNGHYTGLLNNAGHVTKETTGNFTGGMQLQLGEGSGAQERTVIGLKSMSTAQLGRIEITGKFDKSKAVTETRTLSIQDVMGGQVASLSSDATMAMKIIEQAITDVSELRAQIGAVQANMLTTNENNLRVAIENITKTESAIRDTDMASEMTEFTRNQILSNAGINMVAQANSMSQNVLALMG